MTSFRTTLVVSAVGAFALTQGAAAAPVTVISHNFANAGRTSNPLNGTPAGGTTAITGLDADTGVAAVTNTWNGSSNDYVVASANGSINGSAGGPTFFDTINAAYDDAASPTPTSAISGASLRIINVGAAYSISTYFPNQTLAAGESLSASFKVKVTRSAPGAGADSFRVGLFDSADATQLTANSTSLGPSAFDDDKGYMVRYTTAAGSFSPTATNQQRDPSGAGSSLFAGTVGTLTSVTTDAGGAWAVNAVYDVTIGVARSADGASITLTSTFGDGAGAYDDASFSAVDAASPYVTFDQLGIFFGSAFGSANPNQRVQFIDDVVVTYTPIPEPTTACVLAIGGLIAMRRRRIA